MCCSSIAQHEHVKSHHSFPYTASIGLRCGIFVSKLGPGVEIIFCRYDELCIPVENVLGYVLQCRLDIGYSAAKNADIILSDSGVSHNSTRLTI